MEARNLPSFKELLGGELEKGIMDPSHVMVVVRLSEEVREKLVELEKLEIDVSSKAKIAMALTELATTLRMKYGYTLDVEMVGNFLYHITRGLNLYPCSVVAHYWPEVSPVVFLLNGEIAVVVAPRVE